MTAGDQWPGRQPAPGGREPWGQPPPAPQISAPISGGGTWGNAPVNGGGTWGNAPVNGVPAADGPAPESPLVDPAPEAVPLKGWAWLTGGMLCLVTGVLWTAQGLDLVTNSSMSGVKIFAVIGPVVAIAGLALIVIGVRTRSKYKRSLAA
ncbi:hypothetical protein [Winogradskya humida]|uniref:Integral membrane protein n=1 Tax=Winogradskya humida TaxID=113566 RepID=A0ABQ3ZPZ8_9ACTN|nr:hypothetical protein [Actinoplanes humidus]GIE20659.1 hypothetical protein Ahu01nite_037610 [Actinoplanes humidus]